jgi:hypothetical protein
MKIYKIAKKYDEYSKWFYSRIRGLNSKGISPFDILKKHNLMADDIFNWYKKIEKDNPDILRNLRFETAVKRAKEYFDNEAKAKFDKRERKREERYITKEDQNRALRDKYIGRDCQLNGYPAKIEENIIGDPVIKNDKGHQWGGWSKSMRMIDWDKSWATVGNHFPYFWGGGIYRLTDTMEDIQRKIEEEESRPPHPVQSKILKALRFRLNVLIQKAGQYRDKCRYYPFPESEASQDTQDTQME